MKIAVWHNLPSGGGKRSLYDHVRGLVARGHMVEAWCPSTADQSYLPLSKIIPEHILSFDWQPSDVDRRLLRYRATYRNVVGKIEAMDRHCLQCANEINKGGFDLLFVNSCMFFRVSSIGRCVNLPKVIYLQEPYRPLYEAMPKLPWLAVPARDGRARGLPHLQDFVYNLVQVQALRVQAREEWLNAQAFDEILVNSYYSRESVLRAYGLESHVCYLGVDTDLFRPLGIPREDFVVGVGGVHFSKGIDRAVRAIATITKTKRPKFVWLGNFSDRRYQQDVEKLAANLGVDLVFKIPVPPTELVDPLSRASVMIYTPRLEPLGLAPLEANACGTPVVAIAEGGVRETIVDGVNGLLLPSADPKAIGDAVLRLLMDPQLVSRIGSSARHHIVENWSLGAAVNRLENNLISVCGHVENVHSS